MNTPIFNALKRLWDKVTGKKQASISETFDELVKRTRDAAAKAALDAGTAVHYISERPQLPRPTFDSAPNPPTGQPEEVFDMNLTPDQMNQLAQMVASILAPQIRQAVATEVAANKQPDQSALIAQLVDKLHQSTPTQAPQVPAYTPPAITAAPYAFPPNLTSVTSPAGTVRTYPAQLPSDVNLFTYVSRVSQIVNPATGQPYYPPGATGVATQFPSQGRTWPDCVDEMLYPGDWDGGRGAKIKAEQDAHFATAQATGPFDPNTLKDDDLYYLMHCGAEMTFDPRQLGRGLFYGPDVGRMGGQKYSGPFLGTFQELEARVNPAVVQCVREMAQSSIKPWMAVAFPELGSPRWRDEHLSSWAAGWRRLHPGREP